MTIYVLAAALFCVAALCVYIWWRSPSRRMRRHGKDGERKVARLLSDLKRKDFIVLNDLLVPSQRQNAEGDQNTSQIDHVVVSTRGIFVIETKSHVGRISGSEHAQYWQQHLHLQSRFFYNPLLQNASHVKALRRHIRSLDPEFFVSTVVFTDARRLDITADDIIEPRTLLPDRHIRRTFDPALARRRHWWRPSREVVLDDNILVMKADRLADELKRRPPLLSREEMEEIAEKIARLDIRGRGARRRHTSDVRQTAKAVARDIRHGVCPRCGSPLRRVEGKHGPFLACTAYPDCRFTTTDD